MTDTHSELKNIIEAALLVAGTPLTLDKMLSLFPEDSRPARDDMLAALKQIENECENRGIELKQIEKGWRFQTREKYADWIARLSEERPVRYSRALLETLAIIAYRQPVTRGEIEDIRGVAVSSEIIKTLIGREWIRQVGTRDVPGRPALYGTTRGFLEHFNLTSLEGLPPLAELRDVDKIAAELNLRLPVDEPAGAESGENEASTGDSPGLASDGGDDLSADASEAAAPMEAAGDDAGNPPATM
jgi:segregation and condensation protein B